MRRAVLYHALPYSYTVIALCPIGTLRYSYPVIYLVKYNIRIAILPYIHTAVVRLSNSNTIAIMLLVYWLVCCHISTLLDTN